MRIPVIIAITALTFFEGADKPKSPSAVKAQRTYENSVRVADKQQRQSLQTAQVAYLKELKEASDAALEAKDLKAANEIEAARTAIAAKKPITSPTFQRAIDAQRTYEDSVKAVNEQHLAELKSAEEVYLKVMQLALDETIVAKDLTEANRIDAAIKAMQQKIEARNVADAFDHSTITNSIGMEFRKS